MGLINVEHKMIEELDKVVDGLGIEWQSGGSQIRAVMFKAIGAAYEAGRAVEKEIQKQKACKHSYLYNTEGGKCQWCGQENGQDSSD